MALRAANGLLDGVTALLVLLAVVWSGYALWDNKIGRASCRERV